MTRAIYPGTFDPITNGHLDLIKRAASLFDEVIIAVATSHHKKNLLEFEDRFRLVAAVTVDLPNVAVVPVKGLLVDCAKEHSAKVVIRGLRTAADFEYEFQMAGMNRRLNHSIETIFMTPSQDTLFISATLVREVMTLGGDPGPFVPPAVLQFIKAHPHVA